MSDKARPAPIELVRRSQPDGNPEFIACGSCGHIYSPRIYATGIEKGVEHARKAAEDCVMCQAVEKTPEDERRQRENSRERRIQKATVVHDLDYCFSDDGDCFYTSPSDAADAGETGVFGASFVPYRIDISNVLESITDNHHEDASVDDLVGVDELVKAMEDFNNQQTMGSYEMNDKEWQKVPQKQTFAMIKPDATQRGIEDDMMKTITEAGFRIVDTKRKTLTRAEAEHLYAEHRGKEHFDGLVDYTISGEVVLMLIEGEGDNVPADFRALMGATDHTKAEPHTLRALYAVGYRENSIHGSDSPRAAIDEIIYFMG